MSATTFDKFIGDLRKLEKEVVTKEMMLKYIQIAESERVKGIDAAIGADGSPYRDNKNGDTPFARSRRYKRSIISATNTEGKMVPTNSDMKRIIGYHETGTNRLPRRSTFGFYQRAIERINKAFEKDIKDAMKKIFG